MKKIFLFGGTDLEMLEIKEILKQHKKDFIDKQLSWGAKLSDYNEYLNFDGTIYGIELEEDVEAPLNYKQIDHHGKLSHMPSSLEQIATILNIELSREQKLIAANDSEYIYGMKKLCASKEEIRSIRKKDRDAQGITKEDEKKALLSLEEASLQEQKYIVFSQTQMFTVISDLVYEKYNNYIIYNDDTAVFYGYEINKIIDYLNSKDIKDYSYYYGGKAFGFLGLKKGFFNKKEIENLIQEIDKLNEETIHSYHTFMFPFIFKEKEIDEKIWQQKKFELQTQKDYNEYIYFYKHVQDALYNLKEPKEKNNDISKYYEHKNGENGTYTIECKKDKFSLSLDGISLRVFNTEVAILSFNLKNTQYKKEDEILAINDFGRRIYPQFLGKQFTKDTKDSILPNCITLKVADEEFSENFDYFDDSKNLKEPNELPSFIDSLIKSSFDNIDKIIDDRMFVISQYNNDTLVEKLQDYNEKQNRYEYEQNDWWYQYIFVDGDSKTCQSKHMSKKLIEDSTYDRWVEWGTLFGVSRYSFVAVTGSGYGKEVLLPHMQTIYFQIFSLLLAYRASIIKFSNDIQDTTNENKNISEKTRKLYKEYLNFLNKLYFKEVTAQDQGVELYNKAIKVMDIEKYIQDLDSEINELHSYVDLLEEKQTSKKLNTLTWIGGVLLPPSIVTGFLGMNTLGNWEFENGWYSTAIVIASGLLLPIYLGFKKIFKGES